MKNSNIVLGVIAGAAVGAIIGVLFAPHKGSKTRRRIVNKGVDLTEDMKEKFDDVVTVVQNKYNTSMKEARQAVKQYVHDNV